MGGITRAGARQCPGRALSVRHQGRLAPIVSERRYATRYLVNPTSRSRSSRKQPHDADLRRHQLRTALFLNGLDAVTNPKLGQRDWIPVHPVEGGGDLVNLDEPGDVPRLDTQASLPSIVFCDDAA